MGKRRPEALIWTPLPFLFETALWTTHGVISLLSRLNSRMACDAAMAMQQVSWSLPAPPLCSPTQGVWTTEPQFRPAEVTDECNNTLISTDATALSFSKSGRGEQLNSPQVCHLLSLSFVYNPQSC